MTLVDTAGLREAQRRDRGRRRATRAAGAAGRRAHARRRSTARRPLTDDDRALLIGDAGAARIVVVSKSDLPRAWAPARCSDAGDDVRRRSRRSTGDGLDRLRAAIVAALTEREELRDPPAISNVRHLALVDEARGLPSSARDAGARRRRDRRAGAGRSRRARADALEEITGRRTADDLLRHIFSEVLHREVDQAVDLT